MSGTGNPANYSALVKSWLLQESTLDISQKKIIPNDHL